VPATTAKAQSRRSNLHLPHQQVRDITDALASGGHVILARFREALACRLAGSSDFRSLPIRWCRLDTRPR
jgi:hypothetical protein